MKTLKAISSGLAHALTSPGLVLWLWLVCLFVAVPDTLVIRQAVEDSVGSSRVNLDLRERFDMEWYSEYSDEATGMTRALTPTSVRPAAALDNLESWFSGELFELHPGFVAFGIVFALVWALMLGGVLHRFAYFEPGFSLRGLLSHGAEFFPRFVRLMAMTGVAYYGIYRLSRWVFPVLQDRLRDVTVEKTVLSVYLGAALIVIFLLVLVKLSSDYAKVATVLNGRRSMVLAVGHGLRFVLAHPFRTFGAYGGIALLGFAILALYTMVAPGFSQGSNWGVLWTFLIGQAWVLARLVQRLTSYGAAMEIYRDIADR